jgi:hypothetical protein
MEDLFSNTKVKDIVTGEGPMVTVDNTESIESALKVKSIKLRYLDTVVSPPSLKPHARIGIHLHRNLFNTMYILCRL